MRLPTLEHDFWRLRSGEESHRRHPASFEIPPLPLRQSLGRGQAAKLIFDIGSVDEAGNPVVQGEKMWVLVAERCGDFYVGVLGNQPASVVPGGSFYLCPGAEVPFLPEHVVDIADPPQEYIQEELGRPPVRRWPRS